MSLDIEWEELNSYPTLDATPNGATLVRQGKMRWEDIETLWEYLFPTSISTGVQNVVYYGVPHPDFSFLYATKLTAVPFTENEKQTGDATVTFDSYATYTHARASITYEPIKSGTVEFPDPQQIDVDPVPLLTHRWSCGGEYLTIPGRKFWWDSDDAQATSEINAGIFVPLEEHQISWPRVQLPPFSGIRSCIGKCNSSAITLSTGTAAVETLMFLGVDIEQTVQFNGIGMSTAYNMAYRFSERRVTAADSGSWGSTVGGWNHFWRPDKGGFYRLRSGTSVGFAADIIPSTDLISNLFPT